MNHERPWQGMRVRRGRRHGFVAWLLLSAGGWGAGSLGGQTVVFDEYSAYHHIQVLDARGLRTLSFNGSEETRMSVRQPLQGHFEYTEYFHTPWLWNRNIRRVLMIGLGGGSIQRSYLHYYTNVLVETVEIDPVVVRVADQFFGVRESPRHRIHQQDGRRFLQRAEAKYDLLIVDAYRTSRYGSSLPPHLATREFFALARSALTTNGVLAYNVIGQLEGWRSELMAALYRTLREEFPNVYLFPASETMNVVLVATRSTNRYDYPRVQRETGDLVRTRRVTLPTFAARTRAFEHRPPARFAGAPLLTDDFTPLERLLGRNDGAR